MNLTWRQLECSGPDGLPQQRWGGTLTAIDADQVRQLSSNAAEISMANKTGPAQDQKNRLLVDLSVCWQQH